MDLINHFGNVHAFYFLLTDFLNMTQLTGSTSTTASWASWMSTSTTYTPPQAQTTPPQTQSTQATPQPTTPVTPPCGSEQPPLRDAVCVNGEWKVENAVFSENQSTNFSAPLVVTNDLNITSKEVVIVFQYTGQTVLTVGGNFSFVVCFFYETDTTCFYHFRGGLFG